MQFLWDPKKAAANARKHGVGFREASTVFDDPLSATFPDPDHSDREQRFLTVGMSAIGRILVIAHTESGDTVGLSAPERRYLESEDSMKKTSRIRSEEMRAEYDFAAMKGGVRGKYARRVRAGSNVVLLEPDVSVAFPNERAVNEALKGVLNTTRAVRSIGGLPNKALQPTSRPRRAVKGSKRTRAARG